MITSLRGLYSRQVLQDMFSDLQNDLDSIDKMGKKSFGEQILVINNHKQLILEALEGDFGLEYDEKTRQFRKKNYDTPLFFG